MQCTVLLIDDVDDVRELAKVVLEDRGYHVVDFANGREALAWLSSHEPPCVIFLDLQMPVMNGWEFADELARSPRWADIPIVVMSASTAVKRPVRARAFVTKPLRFDRLVDAASQCDVHQTARAS